MSVVVEESSALWASNVRGQPITYRMNSKMKLNR